MTWGVLLRGALAAFIAWSLWLPLHDVLSYPDRVSVLPNLQTDAAAYHDIATALAQSWSLEALPPRHPPGWVTLLGAVYSIAGPSYVAGKMISWLALVLSVVACAFLAGRIHGPAAVPRHNSSSLGRAKAPSRRRSLWTRLVDAEWCAAAVCASSPALRGYVGTLQYEVVTGAALLIVLVLGLLTADASTPPQRLRRAVATGAAAALLMLTRETFVVVVPVIAMWMGHRLLRSTERQSALIVVAVMLTTAAAPVIAWSAVQSIRHHTLITISEKGPMVVELGNNPLANGTYNAPLVGIGQPSGLAFVREYPGRALALAGRKILYFWGVLRDGWNVPRPAAVWLWRATTGVVPLEFLAAIARGGWLLALFVVALWMLGREGLRQWWALPASVFMVMAVHIAVLSSHRFAVPVLPVVFVLVSGPLSAGFRALRPTLRAPAVVIALASLGVIVVLMQYQSWPLEFRRAAVDLDGLSADNVVDPVSHTRVRFADARRGERPIVLLTDEYLPRGTVRIEVSMRRATDAPALTPVARIALVELDGHVSCARDVTADALAGDRFERVIVPCRVTRDTPATLAVYSLGTADIAVDTVGLVWTSATSQTR